MTENIVVTPPQLVSRSNPPLNAWWIFSSQPQLPAPAAFAAESLDLYVRTLISSVATRIVMPTTPADVWASPTRLRSCLAPTLSRRVKFEDQRDTLWSTIVAYFQPMVDSLPFNAKDMNPDMVALTDIAWDVYLLLLAFKAQGELALDPARTRTLCERVSGRPEMSNEARARLAVLLGLLATYRETAMLPGFRVLASTDASFGSRFEEIVNDAHFLQVSALRQFFGLAQNRQAILRDLRKLISFITRHKKWAAGIVAAGQQITLSGGASVFADKALEALAVSASNAPILTERVNLQNVSHLVGYRSVYSGEWEAYIVHR